VYRVRSDTERCTGTEAKEVLTVDDYGAIRRARRDGKSIRQIARELGHSRRTIRHVLNNAEPKLGACARKRDFPVLGPVRTIIDEILVGDENAPAKQRHTAAQVFRRLQQEQGYLGCYSQVQRYVRKHQLRHRETFIPLGHLPGERLEADFGHIYVDFPEGRRQTPFLAITWAYSNFPFVMALPFERTEAILAGMVAAFEFFGCVPKEVWWDNPKTVATLVCPGRQRQLHPRYAALASHYAFEPKFCMPRRGNEKPDAESTVKGVQRRCATPVPRAENREELNAHFRSWCEAERQRIVQSLFGPFEIGVRFAEEKAAAAPLPAHRFDPCFIRTAAPVDKYQTVAFDNNRYSVPRPFAHQMVVVKGYIDQVVIVSGSEVIATHTRSLKRGTLVLDPIHYLAILSRKAGAFDHSPVFRDWGLPACFGALRASLEEHHGAEAGARRFVRVLQLLAEHPLGRVRQAVEACLSLQVISAEAVIQRTRTLAVCESPQPRSALTDTDSITVSQVHVPLPDLSLFNQLLSGGVTGGDSQFETLGIRADDVSPENRTTTVFA
jgi:transposase